MQSISSVSNNMPSMALFIHSSEVFTMLAEPFEQSPEYDDWIESGGRDEDYSRYYNKWHRRVNK